MSSTIQKNLPFLSDAIDMINQSIIFHFRQKCKILVGTDKISIPKELDKYEESRNCKMYGKLYKVTIRIEGY